jgi:RNA polymerase sigma-70 factor (ECF subfamily)
VDDEALRPVLERARAGDSEAFGELFRHTRPDVERVCRRLLGPGPAAEDAASEVFLRAQRGLDGYAGERPFRPWLLGIASHHCIDVLRRRHTESRLFDARDLARDDLVDPGPSPLRRMARAEQQAEVQGAVEALPDRYRLPLVLRYFGELDYAAIGDVLGVSREQVATLVYRAKRRLRERLAPAASREDT